jgi:hypothetical protein
MYSDFSSHFRYRNKTTMCYVDIKAPDIAEGVASLESDEERSREKKWHDDGAKSLLDHLGLKPGGRR